MQPDLKLACHHCQWDPPVDMPMEEVAAHMLVEHDEVVAPGESIQLDLLPYCPRHNTLLTDETLTIIRISKGRERHDYVCPIDHRTYTLLMNMANEAQEKEE